MFKISESRNPIYETGGLITLEGGNSTSGFPLYLDPDTHRLKHLCPSGFGYPEDVAVCKQLGFARAALWQIQPYGQF